MRVITLRPKIDRRHTCCHCATIYMLEESDVVATFGKYSDGRARPASDFYGEWKCPGCGRKTSVYLYELPWSWRDSVMARSPGVAEEYDSLRKAEKERGVRVRDVRLNPVQSKFDKLLEWFRFYLGWK